jgi:hypothetical protein
VSELITVLPELIVLTRKTRADHTDILERVGAVLVEQGVLEQTRYAFYSSRGAVARFLFRLLYPVAYGSDGESFLHSSLTYQDITVRQLAVDAIASLDPSDARLLLERAINNLSATVRSLAFYRHVKTGVDLSDHIHRGLLDPSPSVRSVALWAANRFQINSRDVLEHRLAGALPENKREWLGVLGLAKQYRCLLPEHFLRSALDYSSPSVRFEALSLIDKEQHYLLLLTALDDPADKVFNLAVSLLKGCAWHQVGEIIILKFQTAEYSLPAKRLEALFTLMPKWLQLQCLLDQMEQSRHAPDSVERATLWVKQ